MAWLAPCPPSLRAIVVVGMIHCYYLLGTYHTYIIGSYLKSEEKLEPSRTLSLFKLLILVEPMISEVTSVTSPA